ncbi:MAG: hypothetical protein Q8942_16435 [Bacillota bacterium]|nr:hypothetical protein [Bacillota bacterium]
MFGSDYKLTPRTYAIKSYKKREAVKLKRAFKITFYSLVAVVIIGISVLSAAHYI